METPVPVSAPVIPVEQTPIQPVQVAPSATPPTPIPTTTEPVLPLLPVEQAPAPVAPAPVAPAPVALDLSALGLAPTSGQGAMADSGDDVVMMGLDDDTVKAYDFELYQGRKGQTDRIALLDPVRGIAAARLHYKAGSGYFVCQSKFRMQGQQEMMIEQAPCCEKLEAPRKRFAALIIQYATTPDGNMMNPPTFALKVWRFSEDKYVLLRNVNKDYPLDKHDIKVSCSEEKYQKLAISNTKDCVYKHPLFQQHFGEQINLFVKANSAKLPKCLGKKLTRQELLERLGLATAPQMVGSELPIADLKDLLPVN